MVFTIPTKKLYLEKISRLITTERKESWGLTSNTRVKNKVPMVRGINMTYENRNPWDKKLYKDLENDCGNCFGLCCVALYFSASEGFPNDKEGGRACAHLQEDFTCTIHNSLTDKGLKGCTAYECFGAGQKVAQVTYKGQDWMKSPESAQQMFQVFSIMRQLHEMLWYLTEALCIKMSLDIKNDLERLMSETEALTYLDAGALSGLDIALHRDKVNLLLKKISKIVRTEDNRGEKNTSSRRKKVGGRFDFIGADLRKANLRGMDLGGALLIAADLRGNSLRNTNLIGADLRDADLRGSDLTESLFLTQTQVNTAKGDRNTRLPAWIKRPGTWCK